MEAVEAVVKLPKTARDIGEQLSRAHRVEKEHARDMLHVLLILSSNSLSCQATTSLVRGW